MSSIDITQLADILRAAAKAEILPRFRRLDPAKVLTKTSATDLVTEADVNAERMIRAAIVERWPGTVVIGEEAVSDDASILKTLPGADLAVTVDPVDGTANFAAGLPLYAVMAAVVVKGETVAGIIYDPMGDDWVLAERGGGAWLKHADGSSVRLKVAAPVPLAQMVGHVSMSFIPTDIKPQVLANLSKVAISANYRVGGHDYRTMASGHCHFVMFNNLMPWDHLAGSLITAEAGGYLRKFDGSAYRVGDLSGGLLIATDADSWQTLRREVFTL